MSKPFRFPTHRGKRQGNRSNTERDHEQIVTDRAQAKVIAVKILDGEAAADESIGDMLRKHRNEELDR